MKNETIQTELARAVGAIHDAERRYAALINKLLPVGSQCRCRNSVTSVWVGVVAHGYGARIKVRSFSSGKEYWRNVSSWEWL